MFKNINDDIDFYIWIYKHSFLNMFIKQVPNWLDTLKYASFTVSELRNCKVDMFPFITHLVNL